MKLKPCPFCGSTPTERITQENGLIIVCDKCSMAKTRPNYTGNNGHKKAWNQRNTGWVSVDERLPDFEQVVDVWAIWQGRDKLEHGQRMTDVEYFPEMAFPWNHENLSGFDKVTHWMEKPQPPKAKEE